MNASAFLIKQVLAGHAFAALVQVQSVTGGGVGPIGAVSVQPMVNQVDGYQHQVPHGTIFDLAYIRLQGGTNAVVIDPVVGDIGLAIFCDRDISNVKVTQKVSPPGSSRRNNWSDGIYIGGLLNGTPTSYVAFVNGGISLVTSGNFTVSARNISIDAAGDIMANGNVTADAGGSSVGLVTHLHGEGTPTAAGTVPPTGGT